jgi:tRNA-modifying protein YgfZ
MQIPVLSGPEQEARALLEGWATYNQSRLGRLRIRGADRVAFLHNLTTNDVKRLRPGQGHSTVIPNVKGRILDWGWVYCLEEELLLVTQEQSRDAVLKHLDFYHFMEEVEVDDLTESTALVAAVGPEAAARLDALLGGAASGLEPHAHVPVELDGLRVRLMRCDRFGHKGFRLWSEARDRKAVAGALEAAGAAPVGETALEQVRVSAGEPAFGKELDEERNPLEAGLYGSLSFSKGCYLGQEVIARLDTYHKVARFLVQVRLGAEAAAELSGRPRLLLDGQEVGWLTSWAPVLGGEGFWALGYTSRRCHGIELSVNGRMSARVEATLTTAEGDGGAEIEPASCH